MVRSLNYREGWALVIDELRHKLRQEGWMIDMNTNDPPMKIVEELQRTDSLRTTVESVESGEMALGSGEMAMYILGRMKRSIDSFV
jgi:hypothetical protein